MLHANMKINTIRPRTWVLLSGPRIMTTVKYPEHSLSPKAHPTITDVFGVYMSAKYRFFWNGGDTL